MFDVLARELVADLVARLVAMGNVARASRNELCLELGSDVEASFELHVMSGRLYVECTWSEDLEEGPWHTFELDLSDPNVMEDLMHEVRKFCLRNGRKLKGF